MKFKITILLAVLGSFFSLSAQNTFPDSIIQKPRVMRIMFYNAENFFDTENDSIKNDDEFLPTQGKFWNRSRYYTKQKHISQVITGIGGWVPPEIIGLCEIENRKVLDDFIRYAPINKFHYKIIHKESPDLRGIDVALLYRKGHFLPISYKAFEIRYPFSNSKTRDILYVKGQTKQHDTLHIFVNHWPSRWGGQLETERKRMFVASVLRKKVDSVFQTNHRANIIIMGDFNDYPENNSIKNVLKANDQYEDIKADELYNLSAYLQNVKHQGTHKHEGKWGTLDQFIVSGALLDKKNTVYTSLNDVHIYNADFLLEEDKQYTGTATNRTYIGFKYHGGYSDHLPTFLDIRKKE
jgi:predicted extracellular nuclease